MLATELYDGSEPINLGTGQETTIREIAEAIARHARFEGHLVWDDTKPDGQPRRSLDTSRARQLFGFEATTSLEEGLSRTIAWYEDPANREPHEEAPVFHASPIEEITDGDELIAIILRGNLDTPGVSFFSPDHLSQQLGFIHHPVGHVIPPHLHNPVPREVMYTQETLFIRDGRVRVDLYRDDRTLLTRRILTGGDVILLSTGGHGFEILDETTIVEVKQGPYAGEGDKTRFEAAPR